MEIELTRGRHADALAHALAGIALSLHNHDPVNEELFQSVASATQEALGDFPAALRHARRAEELVQARVARDVDARVSQLTRKFEDEQRDRELLSLRQSKALDQAQLARQRVQRNAAIVIGVLALGVLALMWSRQRLRERSRRELERAVMTDPLTGLLNRRGLRALVGSNAIASEGYAVVICDIDNFKRINDVHGHDVGDLVLAEMARRLRAELRPEDSAARWGGEEFLLVLGISTVGEASIVAERLRRTIAEPPLPGVPGVPGGLPVTLSPGLAASSHWQGFDGVVRAADQALLQAKREGKNRVVVAPSRLRPLNTPNPAGTSIGCAIAAVWLSGDHKRAKAGMPASGLFRQQAENSRAEMAGTDVRGSACAGCRNGVRIALQRSASQCLLDARYTSAKAAVRARRRTAGWHSCRPLTSVWCWPSMSTTSTSSGGRTALPRRVFRRASTRWRAAAAAPSTPRKWSSMVANTAAGQRAAAIGCPGDTGHWSLSWNTSRNCS